MLGLSISGLLEQQPPGSTPQHITGQKDTQTAGLVSEQVPGLTSRSDPGKTLSLEQMVGQMIMVGFRGFELDDEMTIVEDIRQRHIGGVVLFDYDVPRDEPKRNIESPGQVERLNEQLQQLASTPLFIAIDQEGGQVSRLKSDYGFPPAIPSHDSLAGRLNPDFTYKKALQTASLLDETGFNLNFAPVVDLNLNPENPIIGALERSFGDDPGRVTRHAASFIRAHRQEGVLTAVKHYPGHGSSEEDSHRGMVDITGLWAPVELEPYRRLMKKDLVDAVMTAHVFHEDLDAQYPATLSGKVINGMLRGDLEYEGVVFSDDLQMGAVYDHYGLQETLEQTIQAGVDVLVFANNSVYEPGIAQRAIETIVEMVEKGQLSEQRIRSSYRRITDLKERLR